MVIIQPTPFCNINCSYCYLPDRGNKHVIAQSTVTKLFTELFASGWTNPEITVLWHAGEPLAAPVAFYREAFAAIERLRPKDGPWPIVVKHSFQTNAMLIDDDWCELFREWNVGIGVSIDGPRELHDAHRKTRSGGGTFDKTIAGIRRLRDAGIPFHTLSVLSRAQVCARDRPRPAARVPSRRRARPQHPGRAARHDQCRQPRQRLELLARASGLQERRLRRLPAGQHQHGFSGGDLPDVRRLPVVPRHREGYRRLPRHLRVLLGVRRRCPGQQAVRERPVRQHVDVVLHAHPDGADRPDPRSLRQVRTEPARRRPAPRRQRRRPTCRSTRRFAGSATEDAMNKSFLFAIACLSVASWTPGAQAQPASGGTPPPGYGSSSAGAPAMMPWPVTIVTSVEVLRSPRAGGLDVIRARGLVSSQAWGSPHLIPITQGEPVDG
ncbi:MAG: radical SAM protein, partial [Alphaproteobacteria bacterium]|nr:radical SAM protein [Alphaproteobacteria bacterium]